MTSIDTNVSNYTLSELLAIVGVDEDAEVNKTDILDNTNTLITKFQNKNNPQMASFFQRVQGQLLNYASGLEVPPPKHPPGKIVVEGFSSRNDAIYPDAEKQTNEWYDNEVLKQSDQNQYDKITQRKQKIDIYGNQHVPMNREQIATTDTYELPVKQDSLNPNLKNTINRFVNLDSQFRQYTTGPESSATNYTLDLSDTLKDAISLRLYSYQIPFSWYVIDSAYGNNCFWIIDPATETAISVTIPPGNYTQNAFQTQLNADFLKTGFTFPVPPVYYSNNTGKITMYLYGGSYTDPKGINPSFGIDSSTIVLFYDFTGNLQCSNTCQSKTNHFFNNTLGWLMGYKLPYMTVMQDGNPASSILDLNGTKYLILVIDDYNQNHVNNSLVSITQFTNTLKIPDYYSSDIPYTCVSSEQSLNSSLQTLISQVTNNTGEVDDGLLIANKYNIEYTQTQIVLPSAPRTLTNAQIYTINEINKNNNNLTNYLAKAPTSSDILGMIPVKTSVGVTTGSLLVEFSGSLQDNKRTYFGPVNIDRMAVKLLDDKGNVLNLNGMNWSVTLICECLYQY